MKDLRYLALSEELIADEKEMRLLEKALPSCQISVLQSVCLGSGWILLLLPVGLAALGVISYRGKRKRTSSV